MYCRKFTLRPARNLTKEFRANGKIVFPGKLNVAQKAEKQNAFLIYYDLLAFWKKGLMKAAKAFKLQMSQLSHLWSDFAQILQAGSQWLRDKTLCTVLYPERPNQECKGF